MVDRTVYTPDKLPELPLRQIFGRQRVPEDLCRLVADVGLRSVETFAMLGDMITTVKQTLKTIIPDPARFGDDAPAQELALTALAAVWKQCSTMQDHFAGRRAKMEEDPSKVPEIPGEDHAEFRDTFVARHPDVLLPMSCIESLIGSLSNVFNETTWCMAMFTSTKSARSAPGMSRSLKNLGSPKTQRIFCEW